MELTIIIDDAIVNHLGRKRDDLHDWIRVPLFKILEPEIRKAIIAKLQMQNG